MKRLMLTGFEPFLHFPVNPTQQIVKLLDGQQLGPFQIMSVVLPVEFSRSAEVMLQKFQEWQPEVVVSLGLAAGRSKITPERIAINCCDGDPDNNGVRLEDEPIVADGPAAYFSTLPLREMVNVLKQHHIPAEISNTAGTYLCNLVMYRMLHFINQNQLSVLSGFIHLPATHELALMANQELPSWSLETLTEGVQLALEVISNQVGS